MFSAISSSIAILVAMFALFTHRMAARLAAVFFLLAASLLAQDLESLLERARAAEKIGDYASAGRVYEQALAANPANLEVLKRFGILQQTELKFEESIQRFTAVLAQDPKYPEVKFFLGVSYFGQNNYPQAIHSFEQELATGKPHPRCRFYLAVALQASGRIDEAISQYQRVVAENPKNADALYQLARFYKNASVQASDKLKALDPDSFQLHALMGEVYADEERYADAVKEYRAALAKRPDAQGMHYAIGVAYWVQHHIDEAKTDEAKTEFLLAWKENPKDPLTNLYLGDIAVHEQRFTEALEYLRVAESGQPRMAQVHMSLGECYRGLHQPEKAKTEFLAAIEADPGAAQPHYLLAQVYRDLHDTTATQKELAEFETLSKTEKDKVLQQGPQH